ncbi:MAG: NAD(P)H-hydrate dehydratase [Chloroflexi bacterium]|nr:NAD(P)H-hydrate dehydratase [Chloroflexota bacterium]
MKVVSVEKMRQIESSVDATLFSYDQMMLKAGGAAGRQLRRRVDIDDGTRVTFLIGKGNNGGDGLVMAVDMARHSPAQIRIYLLQPRPENDDVFRRALEAGLFVANASDDHDLRLLKSLVTSADVIVDAIFGIGLRLPLRGVASKVLRAVNLMMNRSKSSRAAGAQTSDAHEKSVRPFVFALDCPSGVDCDTGEADTNTLLADATITFIAAKPGLFTFPAARYVGDLIISPLDIPESFPALNAISKSVMVKDKARSILPPRPLDGHKGSFGKLMVVAGSPNYIGALALSAEAAYRAGTGLVTVATTGDLVRTVAGRLREPTYLALPDTDGAINEAAVHPIVEHSRGYDALLLGCGLGRHPSTKAFVEKLLDATVLPSLVVDADALNILSEIPYWWKKLPAQTIITPHAGEMARLRKSSPAKVNASRWELAAGAAADWNLVVVLKGAHTLIADPTGMVSVIPFKTDALGTAGTGDVLAGVIAGLRAQGAAAFDSAGLGAYAHALAGTIAVDRVGSSRSVIAGDVLEALGWAFNQIEAT